LTASYDRTVKIWDATTGSCIQTLTFADNVWTAKFSHDGKTIGAGIDNNTVSLYRL